MRKTVLVELIDCLEANAEMKDILQILNDMGVDMMPFGAKYGLDRSTIVNVKNGKTTLGKRSTARIKADLLELIHGYYTESEYSKKLVGALIPIELLTIEDYESCSMLYYEVLPAVEKGIIGYICDYYNVDDTYSKMAIQSPLMLYRAILDGCCSFLLSDYEKFINGLIAVSEGVR